MNNIRTVFASVITFGLAWVSQAAEFDFADPKGVNNVQFSLDAPLESINGTASGISGTVAFDLADPASTTGKIVVNTETLFVPNSKMRDHIQGGQWMNTKKYPEIAFELSGISDIATDGSNVTGTASGKLTVKGTTKDVSVPVSLSFLEGKLAARFPGKKGDLLVVRSKFSIKRDEYGIHAGKKEDKVANEIQLSLAIAGGSHN